MMPCSPSSSQHAVGADRRGLSEPSTTEPRVATPALGDATCDGERKGPPTLPPRGPLAVRVQPPSTTHRVARSLRGTPLSALSQLAWAHLKAVVAIPRTSATTSVQVLRVRPCGGAVCPARTWPPLRRRHPQSPRPRRRFGPQHYRRSAPLSMPQLPPPCPAQ